MTRVILYIILGLVFARSCPKEPVSRPLPQGETALGMKCWQSGDGRWYDANGDQIGADDCRVK